jgi:hypothetical protein
MAEMKDQGAWLLVPIKLHRTRVRACAAPPGGTRSQQSTRPGMFFRIYPEHAFSPCHQMIRFALLCPILTTIAMQAVTSPK